ncbi:MAG: serine hydroxymethyltransferase [Desulfovibrionaceae bacterium]
MEAISNRDPLIAQMIQEEEDRQIHSLEMIASENFVSSAVRAAQGSILTHKYAEGYPHHRYYCGCEKVDEIEDLAIARARDLFSAEYANVQPHSGSQANMAVYFAFAKPGDTILAMDLSHGGHLTHGSPVSFSGKLYNFVSYGVSKETFLIDYDSVRTLAHKHKPKIILAGASAYSRDINFALFREIADEVGAILFVDMAHVAGLVATGLHSSPIAHAHVVSTTTHKTLRGARGGMILAKKEYEQAINNAVFPEMQGGPLLHAIAAKAICFQEALQPSFTAYQKQVIDNAKHLSKLLQNAGFSILTGGTDNHLILIDLTCKRLTGTRVADALEKAGIASNKNAIPFDTLPPKITSGLRLGTPALTTRGMKEPEMERIASWIVDIVQDVDNEKKISLIGKEIRLFAAKYPLFAW